jgi:hypothetical protein
MMGQVLIPWPRRNRSPLTAPLPGAVRIDREFDRQHDPALEDLDNATGAGMAYCEAVNQSGTRHLIDACRPASSAGSTELSIASPGPWSHCPAARAQTNPIEL